MANKIQIILPKKGTFISVHNV